MQPLLLSVMHKAHIRNNLCDELTHLVQQAADLKHSMQWNNKQVKTLFFSGLKGTLNGSLQNQKYIRFFLPVVLFISINCFAVS